MFLYQLLEDLMSAVMALVPIVIILFIILIYNSLVGKRNQIENAEGALDAVLKQRFDLIPQLIEVTKQYVTHEEKLLERLVELRSLGAQAQSLKEKSQIDVEMSAELKKFSMTIENYPQLLSNNNFTKLQDAMIDLEKNISASRRFYNSSVIEFNDAIQMFPGVLLASSMGLQKRDRFSIEENEKNIPNAKELFKK